MSKQTFEDGSVLLTGKDMELAMEAMCNRRGRADVSCAFCVHEDDDYCDGCTIPDTDHSCSCHINAPCSHCVGSKFEVSPYLINYKHHKNSNWKWECFKATVDIFEKTEAIERADFHLSAEILTTGERAMYIGNGIDPDFEIEICKRDDFKQRMCKMVMKFDIQAALDFLKEANLETS